MNTWDSQNRLVQCVNGDTTSTFTYGADGLRRSMLVTKNGTTANTDFVLEGQNVIQEKRNGSLYATYLNGPRGVEYREDAGGNRSWYFYDGLGSVLGEVDGNGNVTSTSKYDVYGSVRSNTGTATTKHGFCGSLGHSSENETGLIYMRARYYDPVTGRFISEDRAYDGINWYAYCNNNPVNVTDPDGCMAELIVTGAEEMVEEAKAGAVTFGLAEGLIASLTRSLMINGARLYSALETGGEVMVQVTNKGVSLYNSAGQTVFIHLVNFDNKFGTGNFAHYDVQGKDLGDGVWEAIRKAFERLPI